MDTNTNSTNTKRSFDLARTYYCGRCQRDVSNPCIHDVEAIRRKCIPDPNKKRFRWKPLLNFQLLTQQFSHALFVEVRRYFA